MKVVVLSLIAATLAGCCHQNPSSPAGTERSGAARAENPNVLELFSSTPLSDADLQTESEAIAARVSDYGFKGLSAQPIKEAQTGVRLSSPTPMSIDMRIILQMIASIPGRSLELRPRYIYSEGERLQNPYSAQKGTAPAGTHWHLPWKLRKGHPGVSPLLLWDEPVFQPKSIPPLTPRVSGDLSTPALEIAVTPEQFDNGTVQQHLLNLCLLVDGRVYSKEYKVDLKTKPSPQGTVFARDIDWDGILLLCLHHPMPAGLQPLASR